MSVRANETLTYNAADVTLSLWLPFAGESGQDEFWSNAAAAYYSLTGTTVQVSMYTGYDFTSQVITGLGSSAPPDIFTTYGGTELDNYASINAAADISSLYNESWAVSQIPADAKAAETVNGAQYAIPYELDSDWIFINTALFNKYNVSVPSLSTGWTWDQFQAACDTFKANGIVPVAMSGANTWALTFPEEYMFERLNGPTAFADALARETNFTNSYNATDTAIQQWVNDNDFQPGWQSADYAADALPLFQNGQAAMWIQGTWAVQMTYNNGATFQLGVAPWPYTASNPAANGYIFGEYTGFVVANATKHLAQAEDFLSFISQPYWLSEYVNLTGDPIAQTETTYSLAYPPTLQTIQAAIASAPSLLIRLDTLAPPAFDDILDAENFLVFTGQTTPSIAATTIEAAAVDILGVHDVAVANVLSLKTVFGHGYGGNITVVAADLGYYLETFNVSVYLNTTIIASQNVILPSEDSTIVTFILNTTGFALGNYTLSAVASQVPNETNKTNNNCTGGTVTVTILGDINGDFKVDMKDIALVARAFGSDGPNYLYVGSLPSANWNPNADVNGDGKVDMRDIALVARHFGQHYP